MNDELITSIEVIQNNIEKFEKDYQEALLSGSAFEVLFSIRKKIKELKNELTTLELRLLDELPSKKK